MNIDVRIEGVEKLRRNLETIRRELGDRAMTGALNKTAAKARTEMTRAITSEFNLKARDVRSQLSVIRARRGRLQAELNPFGSSSKRGRALNVIHFLENRVTLAEGRRRKKSGTQNVLRFKIKKTAGVKSIKGAFVGNKGRTIFERIPGTTMASRANSKGKKHKESIKPVQTIGVKQMFNTRRINARVIARIRKELPVEMDRAVRHVLRSTR